MIKVVESTGNEKLTKIIAGTPDGGTKQFYILSYFITIRNNEGKYTISYSQGDWSKTLATDVSADEAADAFINMTGYDSYNDLKNTDKDLSKLFNDLKSKYGFKGYHGYFSWFEKLSKTLSNNELEFESIGPNGSKIKESIITNAKTPNNVRMYIEAHVKDGHYVPDLENCEFIFVYQDLNTNDEGLERFNGRSELLNAIEK